MGTVYEALDQRLNSIVAIKETHLTTEEARRAFEHEASLLANLRHRSLPSVIDHFSENDSQYLVMKFIPGEDLAQMLDARKQPFPIQQVLQWGDELLSTLEYLHAHNPPILHRDIKPSNLKVTADGELFLLDFGLAKGAAGQMPTLLTSRSVKGYTPVYSPLEQIHGGGTDPRSDLYAVGATLYHLMTGVPPIDAPTRFLAIDDEQPDPLPAAEQIKPSIPHLINDALSSAMAMNRRQRPTNASALRTMLAHAAATIPSKESRAPDNKINLGAEVPGPTLPAASEPLPKTQPSTPIIPTIPAPPPETAKFDTDGSTESEPRRNWRPILITVFSVVIGLALLSFFIAGRLLTWTSGGSNATEAAASTASPTPNATIIQLPPSPELTVTPPEAIKVRLRLISEGASGCSVYDGMKVTLIARGQTFQATTNRNGYASFVNVPCGDVAKISAPQMQMQMGTGTFSTTRQLPCSTNEVYLGSYGDLKGRLISETFANACHKPY